MSNHGSRVQELRQRVLARMPASSPTWCDIRNADGADGGPAVIRIYDEIHWLFGVSAEQVAEDLAGITTGDIRVEINSPGGDVFDGIAIYNALRAHPARVTTRVDGIAASAASIIVQAGDHRQVMSSGQLMIHEAWGIAIGPAPDHREMADLLDKQNDIIARIYGTRSGRDAGEFREMMRTDTYLSDQESLDLGLVDEIVEPERVDAASNRTSSLDGLTAEQVTDLFASLEASITSAVSAAMVPTTTSVPDGAGTPSAGEREDIPSADSQPTDLSGAQALLDALTTKQEVDL